MHDRAADLVGGARDVGAVVDRERDLDDGAATGDADGGTGPAVCLRGLLARCGGGRLGGPPERDGDAGDAGGGQPGELADDPGGDAGVPALTGAQAVPALSGGPAPAT